MLFTAGFIASQGLLNIAVLIFRAFACAVVGIMLATIQGISWGTSYSTKKNLGFFIKRIWLKPKTFMINMVKKPWC